MTDSQADEAAIRDALKDPVPEVRAAAAAAHSTAEQDESVDALLPLLEDPVETVRSAALAGMLSKGGFEGAMLAGQKLAALLSSESATDRQAAAHALGAIGRSGTRRLSVLLGDPDASVRLAAANAAHDVADARLVPALVERLREQHTRAAAAHALAAIGTPCIEPLASLLRHANEQRAVRLVIPRILRTVHDERSYVALRDATEDGDSHVRLRVYSALSRLREAMARAPEPLEAVQALVEREIRETLTLSATYAAVRAEIGTPLLDEAVEFSAQRGVRRVLRILELRYDPAPIRLVRERVHDPARRANALEVLDTELEPAMRAVVMPFLDDVPSIDKARRIGITVSSDADALLRTRLHNRNPYSVLMALDAARVHRRPVVLDEGARLLEHTDPLVREGALLALSELALERTRPALETLRQDPDPQVARIARTILARAAGAGTECPMYTTVEKLLMLRATPMFQKLRGEDLAPLARVAEVETYEPGDTIFDEGDPGDSLFVVVRGKVEISKGGKSLATIGANEAFGEMSVLDEEARSACAKAVEHVEVLRISSEEFYEVLHEQVEIAEGVIRVLSRRLREANAALERVGRE